MTETTTAPPTVEAERAPSTLTRLLTMPATGPAIALVVIVVVFSLVTDTFLTGPNISLLLQQAVVIGTLALGQTLIILTAGIDLANGAIAVLGTIVAARLAMNGNPLVALLVAFAVCGLVGTLTGGLVTRIRLPPFIVTLGLFTAVTAATKLYAGDAQSYPVTSDLLTWLGQSFDVGEVSLTYGSILLLIVYAVFWYALTWTAWGRHVYAVGNNPEAARLTGINVGRVLLSVYVTAGLLYALAAWQAIGRIPNADTNAYQMANLASITAVVIGGTSLFGGRGGVVGTLVGTLIVGVLRSGLTQAGIDALYQNVATGLLVIVAVAVDRLTRGGGRS